jgi:hypothetical protein
LAKTNPIMALNGLSLIEHIDGKDKKKALKQKKRCKKSS